MHWVRFLHWTTFAVVELSWLIGVTCVRMVSRVWPFDATLWICYGLSSLVFYLFGVMVLPSRVIELLECSGEGFVKSGSGVLLQAVLLFPIWIIWKEHNKKAFEDLEQSTTEVNFFCIPCLIGWFFCHAILIPLF